MDKPDAKPELTHIPTPQKGDPQIKIVVDEEESLESRISRLEHVEMLRISVFQLHQEMEQAAPAQKPHLAEQLATAQKTLGQTLNAVSKSVRRRLGAIASGFLRIPSG